MIEAKKVGKSLGIIWGENRDLGLREDGGEESLEHSENKGKLVKCTVGGPLLGSKS